MDIKKVRKEKGISQYDLAYLAEIGRFRLFQAEKGHLILTEKEIGRLKNALMNVNSQPKRKKV